MHCLNNDLAIRMRKQKQIESAHYRSTNAVLPAGPLQTVSSLHRSMTGRASEVCIQAKAFPLFLPSCRHHDTSFLILTDTFFKEVSFPLQRYQLHPVKWIARAE